MTAREHAEQASRLLVSIAERERELDELDEHDRLAASVSGAFTRYNRNVEHTIALAQAHALTAIALADVEQQ